MATRVISKWQAPKDFNRNPDYVYIGRGSIWGNPYKMRPCPALKNSSLPKPIAKKIQAIWDLQERQRVINAYEAYLRYRPDLQAQLHTLIDKTLVCYCSPKPCHGDVLVKAIERWRRATVAHKPALDDVDAWLYDGAA